MTNTQKSMATLFAASLLFAGQASAKGCLTGAAVGGTAGHFAGNHAIVGAAVGCAIGRHRANKKDKMAAAQTALASPVAGSTASTRPAPSK